MLGMLKISHGSYTWNMNMPSYRDRTCWNSLKSHSLKMAKSTSAQIRMSPLRKIWEVGVPSEDLANSRGLLKLRKIHPSRFRTWSSYVSVSLMQESLMGMNTSVTRRDLSLHPWLIGASEHFLWPYTSTMAALQRDQSAQARPKRLKIFQSAWESNASYSIAQVVLTMRICRNSLRVLQPVVLGLASMNSIGSSFQCCQ